MDAELRKMLVTTITRKAVTARTPTGDETLGAAVVIPAFIEMKKRYMQRAGGGFDMAIYPFIVTEAEVKMSDRLWLAGDSSSDVSKSRRPTSVNVRYEPENPLVVSHYEIEL